MLHRYIRRKHLVFFGIFIILALPSSSRLSAQQTTRAGEGKFSYVYLTTFDFRTSPLVIRDPTIRYVPGKEFRVFGDFVNNSSVEISKADVWVLLYFPGREEPVLYEFSMTSPVNPDSFQYQFWDEVQSAYGNPVDGAIVPYRVRLANNVEWHLPDYLAENGRAIPPVSRQGGKKGILPVKNAADSSGILTSGEFLARAEARLGRNEAVNVFLDRFWRYEDYIKQNIPYVNYVRDTRQAQVYLLLTDQNTGSGGREYTLTFIGQENFSGMNDTLKYVSDNQATQEETRRGLVRVMQMGLMRYVAKTPFAANIRINHAEIDGENGSTLPEDKWNYWVFRLGTNANFEGEELSKQIRLGGEFRADRVTENWKLNLRYSPDYNENEDITPEETFRTFRRQHQFYGLVVKSLGDHWGAGINGEVISDTRINTDVSVAAGPAVEFNIFPYSIYTRKQFVFQLGIWGKKVDYREETIFDKTSEELYYATLSVGAEVYERWGSARTSLKGNVFFHDPQVNRVEWDGNVDFRIFRGFSVNLSGRASLIHDQLFLAKGDRSIEEILLRRTQLKTNWRFETWFGFSYIFGSPYNNIVNPRFERGGRRRGGRF